MRTTRTIEDVENLVGDFWSIKKVGEYLVLVDQSNGNHVAEIHYSNIILFDGELNANSR